MTNKPVVIPVVQPAVMHDLTVANAVIATLTQSLNDALHLLRGATRTLSEIHALHPVREITDRHFLQKDFTVMYECQTCCTLYGCPNQTHSHDDQVVNACPTTKTLYLDWLSKELNGDA